MWDGYQRKREEQKRVERSVSGGYDNFFGKLALGGSEGERQKKRRANEGGERGRGGRWRVGKASGGGWDLLRAYERRSWATRRGRSEERRVGKECRN